MVNFFNKNKKDKNKDNKININKDEVSKNKRLTGNQIKVKVYGLLNGTPVERAVFDAELIRDKNNNTVIFNEDMDFKEEMPGIQDTLVSDILYKLKSRGNSKKAQLEMLNKATERQEKIIKNEKDGYIKKLVTVIDKDTNQEIKKEEKIKINIQTEMSKLRILKCSKYALDHKDGEGFFESIDIEGNRVLSYVLIDGELIPYWFKTPSESGEPVILVPDVVGRKKFYKEAETEAIQDFNESVDWFWKGWLGVAMKALTVLFLAGLIVWTIFLARWSGDLHDNSLEPKLQELQLENQRIRQQCSEALAQQMENNMIIFDYAKLKMEEDKNKPTVKDNDKSNIEI